MDKKIINFIMTTIIIITILLIGYFGFIYKNNNSINNVENPFETRTALFIGNGASIDSKRIVCVVVNNTCEITFPEILDDDRYVLGWSDTDSKSPSYSAGSTINLTKDSVFYAVTYRKLTLTIVDTNLDYLSSKNISCIVYNNDESCRVVLPNFNVLGYENRGYSTDNSALVGVFYPGSIYTLTKDTILYPIYNTLTRQTIIDASESIYEYNSIIEVERGCSEDIKNNYLDYINTINSKAEYLLIGSKISFLKPSTFDSIWGSNYAGMNYGPSSFRMFDIKCSSNFYNDYYGTMVHELAHTWDFNYGNYFSKNISDENDVINLFIKYKNMNKRPFRDYSYSNIREFLADAYKYYYFKYIDISYNYVNLDYPEDIKNVMDKYICISKNNFEINGCI